MNFELGILDKIQEIFKSGFMDGFMPFVSKLGNEGIIWIVLALVMLIIPKTRKIGLTVTVALIIDVLLCNVFLKPLIGRPRPFTYNDYNLLIKIPSGFSFPSGHTAVSFSAAFALLFSKSKIFVPALILAIIIGFSRMYLHVHFPTDILAGIVVGLFCGKVSSMIIGKIDRFKE